MRARGTWIRDEAGRLRAAVMAAVFAGIGAMALIPVIANPRSAPREIVLVARGMAFYLDGTGSPNPTITVRQGEDIRLLVRNEDPGITHALGTGALGASIDRLQPGAAASVSFRAPTRAGRFEYVCPPHAQMMKGTLVVE